MDHTVNARVCAYLEEAYTIEKEKANKNNGRIHYESNCNENYNTEYPSLQQHDSIQQQSQSTGATAQPNNSQRNFQAWSVGSTPVTR